MTTFLDLYSIRESGLVDVPVIAVLVFELLDVLRGGLARDSGLLCDDGVERRVDVLCHTGGIATDVVPRRVHQHQFGSVRLTGKGRVKMGVVPGL